MTIENLKSVNALVIWITKPIAIHLLPYGNRLGNLRLAGWLYRLSHAGSPTCKRAQDNDDANREENHSTFHCSLLIVYFVWLMLLVSSVYFFCLYYPPSDRYSNQIQLLLISKRQKTTQMAGFVINSPKTNSEKIRTRPNETFGS
jgi:hypothetical protein